MCVKEVDAAVNADLPPSGAEGILHISLTYADVVPVSGDRCDDVTVVPVVSPVYSDWLELGRDIDVYSRIVKVANSSSIVITLSIIGLSSVKNSSTPCTVGTRVVKLIAKIRSPTLS